MLGRLSGPSSWCASTNYANEYLQIDFGKIVTMSGPAIHGDPVQSNWIKDFYIDYGTELTSLQAYSEDGSTKVRLSKLFLVYGYTLLMTIFLIGVDQLFKWFSLLYLKFLQSLHLG